jgi:hypothetical protein
VIYIGSRYQYVPVRYMLDGRSGLTRPTVIRSNEDVKATTTTVTHWEYGVRLDIVGSAVYNDPEKWWQIMDQNPDVLDPMSFEPGASLRIP